MDEYYKESQVIFIETDQDKVFVSMKSNSMSNPVSLTMIQVKGTKMHETYIPQFKTLNCVCVKLHGIFWNNVPRQTDTRPHVDGHLVKNFSKSTLMQII